VSLFCKCPCRIKSSTYRPKFHSQLGTNFGIANAHRFAQVGANKITGTAGLSVGEQFNKATNPASSHVTSRQTVIAVARLSEKVDNFAHGHGFAEANIAALGILFIQCQHMGAGYIANINHAKIQRHHPGVGATEQVANDLVAAVQTRADGLANHHTGV